MPYGGVGRVPAAVRRAAQQPDDADRVDAADHADDVLAVGREEVVLRPGGVGRADLGALLAVARHPEAQLALALQVGGLDVEARGRRTMSR